MSHNLIFALVIFFAFQNFSKSRFGTDQAENSDGERTAIMIVSLEIMKQKPINGVGYGQFIEKFADYLPYGHPAITTLYRRNKIVTHNDYLRIIDELGIPAFLLLLMFIGYVYYKGIKNGNVLWYLFSYALIFSAAHNNMNALMFWFLVLLPVHYLSLKNRKKLRVVHGDS